MKDLIYVDPLLWIFYGAIIASLLWIAVLIIVAQIYRDKGREDVLEERRVEFKKVGRPKGISTQLPNTAILWAEKDRLKQKPQKVTVTKSKRERTK